MTRYAPPVYRPAAVSGSASAPSMGAMGTMNVGDWLMLLGGGLVTGIGINSVVGGVTKVNFVGIILGGVVALVGGTVFVREMGKLLS